MRKVLQHLQLQLKLLVPFVRCFETLRTRQHPNVGQINSNFGAEVHPSPGAVNELLDGIGSSIELSSHPETADELQDQPNLVPAFPGGFASASTQLQNLGTQEMKHAN